MTFKSHAASDLATRALAEAAILAVMARPTFTFHDCHSAGSRAADGWDGAYRLADRLLQRERKAGRIRLTTNKRVWANSMSPDQSACAASDAAQVSPPIRETNKIPTPIKPFASESKSK